MYRAGLVNNCGLFFHPQRKGGQREDAPGLAPGNGTGGDAPTPEKDGMIKHELNS